MNKITRNVAFVFGVIMVCGAGNSNSNGWGCAYTPSASSIEASQQDAQMKNVLISQPVPVIQWSLERHMLIQLYQARQRATSTFSVVQSEYTGKVLWSCPSMGFPLPYATQLTNPLQVTSAYGLGNSGHYADGVVAQQEPNGLYTPSHSDATWVPCVDAKGNITPVYEEKHVTVFFQPMQEVNGTLVPVAGTKSSIEISTKPQ